MSRVVVCGSVNIDLVGTVTRLPHPGETVAGSAFATYPGGKGANQAVAAARAGIEVVMLGAVGADGYGRELSAFLGSHGVDTSRLATRPDTPTGTALILVDATGENVIAVIPGANATVDPAVAASAEVRPGDVLVAQFETPVAATSVFFASGRAAGATCVLNPAPAADIDRELLELVDVLVVNETELALVTGYELADEPVDLTPASAALAAAGFAGSLVVTRGARGVVALADGETTPVDGHAVQAVDATGAGDCFVGSLAAELSRGIKLPQALRYANAASALAVQTPGAGSAMPSRDQVTDFLARN